MLGGENHKEDASMSTRRRGHKALSSSRPSNRLRITPLWRYWRAHIRASMTHVKMASGETTA